MTELSWPAIRRLVHGRASGCCEYCHTWEFDTGQTMHVEPIDPAAGDDPENLALACPSCNLSKGSATTGLDREPGESTGLFNPHLHIWHERFEWIEGGPQVQGITPVGRVRVERLRMNQARIVRARQNWIIAGTHPPAN